MGFDPHQNIIDSINTTFFEPCVAEVRVVKAGKHGTVAESGISRPSGRKNPASKAMAAVIPAEGEVR